MVKRGVESLNIHGSISNPVNRIIVNINLYRNSFDYRPFLYNVTFDFCQMVVRNSGHQIERLLMKEVRWATNLNHSCPYTGIIVDKFVPGGVLINSLQHQPAII